LGQQGQHPQGPIGVVVVALVATQAQCVFLACSVLTTRGGQRGATGTTSQGHSHINVVVVAAAAAQARHLCIDDVVVASGGDEGPMFVAGLLGIENMRKATWGNRGSIIVYAHPGHCCSPGCRHDLCMQPMCTPEKGTT
jgi:hypothetical protein